MQDDYYADFNDLPPTVDDYRIVVAEMAATIRILEDRINGVDRDYASEAKASFDAQSFAKAMTDKPHWRWNADYESAKDYSKDKPTRIPEGDWKFYCGGPIEMLAEQFFKPSVFHEKLMEMANKKARP
jgi:hypothetical protein